MSCWKIFITMTRIVNSTHVLPLGADFAYDREKGGLHLDGILPVYKSKGMTSHDCVNKLRKLTQQQKIGHTGTLDPGAAGVLPVCLGQATKVAQYMADDQKTYEAEVTLGTATLTEDREGKAIEEKVLAGPIPSIDISRVLQQWTGTFQQTPPMYSAVKVNGRRLYEYAREGIEVDRPQRWVTINELALFENSVQFNEGKQSFTIHIRCSKGTYMRILAVDIGRSLGYPAHMSALTRTASGAFTLENCLTFAEIEQHAQEETLQRQLMPISQGLQSLETMTVPSALTEKIKNGAVLSRPEEMKESRFTIYNDDGELLAVYQPHPSKPGLMKPEKVFIY